MKPFSTSAAATPAPKRARSDALGLPAHWRRGRALAALSIFALLGLFTFATRNLRRAERSDAMWLRARFSAREKLRPRAPDADIILVEMDDRSTDLWPEPLVAWGPHFAATLDRLKEGGARVIALDWLQPISTSQWFPGYDTQLSAALARAGNVVLVKELRAEGGGKAAHWLLPTPELLYALPDSALDPDAHLGFAELVDKDSVTAAMTPVLAASSVLGKAARGEKDETSFAARIVERYFGASAFVRAGRWEVSGKTRVPLRDDGSLLVNYRGGAGGAAFRRISMSDIARRKPGRNRDFAGKIVLIGASYTGWNDAHYIPFFARDNFARARTVSGMEVQAHLVRTLLSGQPLREPSALAAWFFALALGSCGLVAFSVMRWVRAACVSLAAALAWLAVSLAVFVNGDYVLPATLPLMSLFLASALMGAYRALGEERERAQVMRVWGRYHDPRVVRYALQNPQMRGGEGIEQNSTVLFADLKSFTKTVESLSPTDALYQLNRYLAAMSDAVLENGGLVDKYLGDGLMAQWGVPAERADHERAAVAACLQMQRKVLELAANKNANDVVFGLRLSLHSGPVVAGNLGSQDRLEYTIIGDTVNVAARLQETAKQLDCDFLISQSTYEAVADEVEIGQQSQVEIRGRQKPLRVYEVVGARTAETASVGKADAKAPSAKQGTL